VSVFVIIQKVIYMFVVIHSHSQHRVLLLESVQISVKFLSEKTSQLPSTACMGRERTTYTVDRQQSHYRVTKVGIISTLFGHTKAQFRYFVNY